jgi:plastocyanin
MRATSLLLGLATLLPLALAAAPLAGGNGFESYVLDPLVEACDGNAPPDAQTACAGLDQYGGGVFGGMERTLGGVSWDDFRATGGGEIEAANFYFAARVVLVHDGATLTWVNENPPGGNRHSVASSDWGCDPSGWTGPCQPVLPVPGANFGGGRAFKAPHPLQPGEEFRLTIDIASMNPAGYVALQNGNYLIPYHCYIHGAAQMSGLIVVTPVDAGP